MQDPRIAFGENVRRIRLRNKISQEELAARAGLDRSYVGQVERGETNISLLNLIRLATGLNVKPEYLLKGISSPILDKGPR